MENLEKKVERFLWNEVAMTIAELDHGPRSTGKNAEEFLGRLKRRIPSEDEHLQKLMDELYRSTKRYQDTNRAIGRRVNG